ncbi:MAG: alpha/beta hydrolase [Candidatus Dojkabacteria bacterium]|jgi:pimeloyl-ACP methyl ester carboxylesterase|nr:alpha/beta hydrolase [Candidatus Dojkabacteria bacterium]
MPNNTNNLNDSNNFFSHNNGKIYYELSGVENKDAIVFVHGFSLDHRMWEDQARTFSDKYKVLTYDMRGFGKSTAPKSAYSHHDDLFHLLEYLNIQKCNIVGLSFGGEIAIDFSISYPDKVGKLVLMDSSLGGYKSTVDWHVGAREFGLEKAKKNWLNHEVFSSIRDNAELFDKLKKMAKVYSGWHWVNKDTRQRLDPPALERLSEINVECLILVGEKDLGYFHDITKVLEKNISNSQKIVIENSGHLVNMEEAEEVNGILFEFLK